MGISINTSISSSIPFSRRVINDIKEHQRRALKDSVESTNSGTNTSPVPAPEEQEEEVITPNTGLQTRIMPAETPEETLQLESLEIEDTGIKQVTSDTQIQDDGPDSQLNDEECDPDIPDDQTFSALQEDNYCTAINDD